MIFMLNNMTAPKQRYYVTLSAREVARIDRWIAEQGITGGRAEGIRAAVRIAIDDMPHDTRIGNPSGDNFKGKGETT